MPSLIQKKKKVIKIFAVLLLLLTLPIAIMNMNQKQDLRQQAASFKKVSGYTVYWDKDRGFRSVQANADLFDSVSPWAYTLDAQGNVRLDPDGGASIVDDTTLAFYRSKNIRIIPAIHNLVNGTWNNGNIVSNIIHNPTLTQTHIANIVNLVQTKGYDGIDIDYENLNGTTDRQAYTNFLTQLSQALHAKGKVLATAVNGKTSEPGTWNGPLSQDYQALGSVVDEMRIMLYDYSISNVSPIAPYQWTDNVLGFAKTKMPASKVMQGIPLYAYDWAQGSTSPENYTWDVVLAKTQQYNASVIWDATQRAPWFTYSVNNVQHTVWFENMYSVTEKLELTKKHDVGGIFFWRLGGEDPGVWTEVRKKLAATAATPTGSVVPTATPTRIPFSPTPTPIPTRIPTATPQAVAATTLLSFDLFLHGLGKGGDNTNQEGQGNFNILHPQRNLIVEVFDNRNQLILTKQGTITFNKTTGKFTGTVAIGTTLTNGAYLVRIKTNQFLRSFIPGIQIITSGQTNTLPVTSLINGDINNDNLLNILDYNILSVCYSDLSQAISCTPENKLVSDLNDDGNVNQFDYNLLIRELGNVLGQ